MKLRLISYDTWKKDHWGNLFGDGYSLCAETYDYNLFGSINPKDLATKLIHDNLSDEFAATLEFVYVPHKYKGYQSKKDWLEVWYKKTEHPFQVGQYILIKWAWPGEPEWGVWKVGKYKFGGIEYSLLSVRPPRSSNLWTGTPVTSLTLALITSSTTRRMH